jgi:hypothetical protein
MLPLFVALAMAASLFVVIGSATSAFACSCVRGDPQHALKNDVVFVGTPIKRTPFGGAPAKQNRWGKAGTGGYITKFVVDRVYKGDVGKTQRIVTSAALAGGCGMVFRGGQTQVVVANRGPEHALLFRESLDELGDDVEARIRNLPATNLCTSLNAPDADEVASVFGPGRQPG